jgi:hypothetical protein
MIRAIFLTLVAALVIGAVVAEPTVTYTFPVDLDRP